MAPPVLRAARPAPSTRALSAARALQDNGPDNKVFIKSVVAGGAPPARAPPLRHPQAGPRVFSSCCCVICASGGIVSERLRSPCGAERAFSQRA